MQYLIQLIKIHIARQFFHVHAGFQGYMILLRKRQEVHLADIQNKFADITLRNIEFEFSHIHLTEVEYLLYQSLQFVHIGFQHGRLLLHGRCFLVQIIRYAGYDGQRCQQLMRNIGEVSQLCPRQFFLQPDFTLQLDTTHIKPDHSIKAEPDQNNVNKIGKPGLIKRRFFYDG